MFFQISPVIHKKPKAVSQAKTEDEESRQEILSLGPFTPNPKIVFDNVVIGTVQSRKLLVQNPTGHDINIFIKKPIPEEMNLILSWTEARIEKHSEVLLEMVWGPVSEGACRHSFILSDGKRINRDIAITFKSVMPKQVKANGTQKKTKPKVPPPKLQLTRKPVSPTKKLKPQRKSPIKFPSPKKQFASKYYSPPQRYRQEQRVEYKVYKEVKAVSEKQQFCNYQASAWERENNCFNEKQLFYRENKENVSPDRQRYLCNLSGSFSSPTNTTFPLENKYGEQTNVYGLERMPERRETYVLQTERLEKLIQSNSTFEIENTYIEVPDPFSQKSKDNSPRFRDSLDSPVSVLRERNDDNQQTPTLESMLNKSRPTRKYLSPSNFEYKLKVQSFAFSPALSPYTNASPNVFFPSICSTASKPPSTNNSRENIGTSGVELHIQSQTIENNDTYTKNNTSSGTFVKESSSFETYVKGNLSGDTYVKDSSLGDLANFEMSPLSTRTHFVPSPVFLKPKSFDFSPAAEFNARNGIDSRLGVNLSAIAEESCISNDSYLRAGSKRKSSSFSSQHAKRERASVEPKKDWSKTGGAAVRIAKNTSGLNLKQFANSFSQDKSQILSSLNETSSKTVIVQNPFLYANIIDPFMTSQIYSNDEWLDQQERNFKKWLNALLTPPEELSTKNEVDVAKVWHECTKKEVSEASTKETVSLNYHTNKKLEFLRKQAQQMFRSKEMSNTLQKVCLVVESGKLSVREDKDLHLNLKLKSDITRLILGYNPLWLRIGLETIYNEIIPLKSNSDSQGLVNFILERFLKDPYLIKKHKTVYAPKYSSDLKKFILKKFLILVYFLDRAKNEKLIQHDPCLFCKNAVEKDSKSVLIHFARETLAAVGDITKYLKCLGYVVTHVQTYIHEFEYAVKKLGVDLRDGVRLAKVMEIIQMRSDLTKKLRVPAISRLQKVHNTQLVFNSLEESGYAIQYDISPKHIVDGHREKTLSFLWQIIYKFEAPLMVKCATTVQTWFRSLPVILKRRQLKRNREKREMAAQKIQLWYRHQKLSQTYLALAENVTRYIEERKRLLATIKIQSFMRTIICRRRYLCQCRTIIKLQACAKGWLIRHNYKQRIEAAVCIQKNFRRFTCRRQFLRTRNAAVAVQRRYRANKLTKQESVQYKCLKGATIIIQRTYRANCEMRICRRKYITLKTVIVKIQSFFRMCIVQKRFLLLKTAAKVIQIRYRAQMRMQSARAEYLSLKRAAICIQQRFRANQQMRYYRNAFTALRAAVIRIQSYYRMHRERKQFLRLRSATMVIQTRYRANLEMKTTRQKFSQLRKATITLQSYYRMFRVRQRYLALQGAAKVLQQRYRAQKAMKEQTSYFKALQKSVVNIQRRFVANKLQKEARHKYLHVRRAIITIQAYFRMYSARTYFLKLKKATLFVQRKYLAQKAMKKERRQYQTLTGAAIVLQRRWRARQMFIQEMSRYSAMKKSAINIQRRFRAKKLMLQDRQAYLEIKTATVKIQLWYRAQILMKRERRCFIQLIAATVVAQRRFKANVLMREKRNEFLALKKAATTIQRKHRALLAMKTQKSHFEKLKKAAVFVQQKYRAKKIARATRSEYIRLKNAAVLLQRRFRTRNLTIMCVTRYNSIKWAAVVIQRRFRAEVAMRIEMSKYTKLRHATFVIQRKFRATVLAREQRQWFLRFKKSVNIIQSFYRSYLLAKRQRDFFLATRRVVINIQRFARGFLVRRKFAPVLTPEAIEARRVLKKQNAAAVKIQACWRGYSLRKSNIPVMIALRKRTEHKAAESKQPYQGKTLAQRCEAAMLCITAENSSLIMIINALEDLDFITRHCRDLCIRLSQILPHQLYIVITSAARSLPEMNALNTATLILINFCKYPQTRENSWDPEYMDGVINVLLHWCDKEAPLFSSLCTLLWLFGHKEEWKKVILGLPNIQHRLIKIDTLVHRKQNMVMRSKKVNNNSVYGPIGSHRLPMRTANWGLDYDRPNTFTNAVFALNNLLSILNIRT